LVLAALQVLQQTAEARVWPLFNQFTLADPTTGEGLVVLKGFVTARVVLAAVVATGPGGSPGPYLELILQPAMRATGTAVTDAARRRDNLELYNRYVCKVRLEE
jgi:hypothetical protein